jgi:rfaE bifunctional protein nucleotidyltransferase chain/domain
MGRIMMQQDIKNIVRTGPVVFTNGVFDILHRGHVRYLAHAKRLGSILIVGVNSDSSAALQTKVLSGETSPPINSVSDRMEVLAALAAVDYVVEFDDLVPRGLIQAIRPNIYCKGGDYSAENTPEGKMVEEFGGKAVTIPYVLGYSSRRYRRMMA